MANNYKKMKHVWTLVIIMSLMAHVHGQISYNVSDSVVLRTADKVLSDPFTGGIQAPLFSMCDLNGDNKKDIVLFDKFDAKILTYQNVGTATKPVYKYTPQFEPYFPILKPKGWMLMRDFNRDGYEDIFTSDGMVYKNISYTTTGHPAFDLLPLIYYRNNFPDSYPILYNLLSPSDVHLPGIADVDFDGDLDMITYTNVGGAISYYINEQEEKHLAPDSMRFRHVDMCWGSFRDIGSTYLQIILQQYDHNEKFYKRHTTGSSLTPLDLDNDGDMDLLMGNSVADNMVVLKNGLADYAAQYDSMIFFDSIYPRTSQRMRVKMYPAGYHLDIDGDGNRDMVIAPYATSIAKETNQISFYKNTGADLVPNFTFSQGDFLCEHTLDHGSHTAPGFWDYDGDGDKDLFIATNGDYDKTGNTADRMVLYTNIGTAAKPVFQLNDTDFASFSSYKIVGMIPAFADINGDGKTDILIGSDAGTIRYYQNTSSSATTTTPTFINANNNYVSIDNIDVGLFSAPCVADINKDGKKDLLVGAYDGSLFYYENTGTVTAPVFTKKSSRLGKIFVADSVGITNVVYEFDTAGNPIGIISYDVRYDPTPYVAPAVADLDNDGRYEIICGNSAGTLKAWEITDNLLTDSFPMIENFYSQHGTQTDVFYNKDFGYKTIPAIADIAGGVRPEILIGNYRGGLNLLTPNKYLGIRQPDPVRIGFSLYPNPASGLTTLYIPQSAVHATAVVYDQLGQSLFTNRFEEGSRSLDVNLNGLPNGIYFVTVTSDNVAFVTQRLVVLH